VDHLVSTDKFSSLFRVLLGCEYGKNLTTSVEDAAGGLFNVLRNGYSIRRLHYRQTLAHQIHRGTQSLCGEKLAPIIAPLVAARDRYEAAEEHGSSVPFAVKNAPRMTLMMKLKWSPIH